MNFRLNRLSQILGELPFTKFTGFKVFGLGMVEISNFLMKKYKKVNDDNVLTLYSIAYLANLLSVMVNVIENSEHLKVLS